MRKVFTFGVIALLSIASVVLLFMNSYHLTATTYVVELTEEGFVPSELNIREGDSVQFLSRRPNRFWPASNTHPIHTIYPQFDPKRPLEPNETWEFTFTQKGKWGYHDHLYPFYKGNILVQ